MKKVILLLFVFSSIVLNAQVAKILKGVNDAGDVATFELDCSKNFQVLAKGMRYNIIRHEFKGVEKKNVYYLLLVMEGVYLATPNSEMTISAVMSDGSIISNKETIEDDGFFDGACTLKLNNITSFLESNLQVDKIIVHTNKDVVYVISDKNKRTFKTNLSNIINEK